MNSTEKAQAYLDWMREQPDSEISGALPFPVPAGMIRLLLDQVEEQLPTDPVELDALIRKGLGFLTGLLADEDLADEDPEVVADEA